MEQPVMPLQKRSRRTAAQLEHDRLAYLASPNRCLTCAKPILPHQGEKLSETIRRRFCTRSCAASYNNSLAVAPKKKAKPRFCVECGARVAPSGASNSQALCSSCNDALVHRLPHLTRAEAGAADLRRHMRLVLADRLQRCQHCGYDTHVEAVHLRPIDTFLPDATLAEIDAPANLVYLCPNHRWEYEHNLLTLNADTMITVTAGHSPEQSTHRKTRTTTNKRPLHYTAVASR